MSDQTIAQRVKRNKRQLHSTGDDDNTSHPKKRPQLKSALTSHSRVDGIDITVNATNGSHVCVDELNDDCLRHILSQLSLVERIRCRRVCKRWHELIESLLRSRLAIGMKNIAYDRSDCSLSTRHSVVNEDLMDCALFEWQTNDADLRNAIQRDHSQCVRNLTFIFTKCPKVLSLDLRSIELTDTLVHLIGDYCPQLECLHLNSMVITDSVWQALAQRLSHRLIHLVIRNSIQSKQTPIVEHFIGRCHRLKCLKVTEWDQNLELKWFDCISENVEEIHIACTSAKSLFKSIDGKNTSNIRRLKLSTFEALGQRVIDSIGTNFMGLTRVSLTNCEGFQRRSYRPIAGLVHLRHLTIDLPFANSDEDFAQLAVNCTEMRSFEFSFGFFTLNSLDTICKHWPQLESVSFRFVTIERLNSDALEILMEWKHLKRLCLHGTNISDDICHVVHSLRSLRYLNLDFCNNISKRVVHSFINCAKRKPKELFELSVKETKINALNSIKNVDLIAKTIAKINNLYVYYTPKET